jgi:hypothetical protein
LTDEIFRSDFFGARLDLMEAPVEWLEYRSNGRTMHLLDYPFLFTATRLVDFFRAINFSRMSRAFEDANYFMNRTNHMMSPSRLMTDADARQQLFDQLRTPLSKFLVLEVRRDNILMDSFDQIWRRERRELMRPLKIRLGEDSGEEGFDLGGVQQEYFRLLAAEALDPKYGGFTVDERTKMIWFLPSSPEPVWKFEMIGTLFSLAAYNGLTLPVTFPIALYRMLLGLPVCSIEHIEDGWPDLARGLRVLLEWDEKDGLISDVFSRTYEFSFETFGQQITRDMESSASWPLFDDIGAEPHPDARMVNANNREEYVADYIKWLTDISVHPQLEAFKRGFLTCLHPKSLSLFSSDPAVFQSMVEGVHDIDMVALRKIARYVGWKDDAEHPTIKDFWSLVSEYDLDMKKKLLGFVTASERVPVGGMDKLTFIIQKNGDGSVEGSEEKRLPTSYTCYGILLLPEYESKEILKEKMRMALENAQGFGFA